MVGKGPTPMTPDLVAMHEIGESANSLDAILSSGRYIHFGPFQIDQQREEVTRNGNRVKLQGKVYQALLTLLEKPGEVVTREELRQKLWPGDTHVNYDANVNTTVNKLRLALGDSSDKPIYIETIPRKGYCFIAQPEISDKARTSLPMHLIMDPGESSELDAPSEAAKTAKSDLWIILGVIGLILAGMLLGAGLTRLWISHFAPSPFPFL